MTKEEKQLLLKDLTARLQYKVKVQIDGLANSILTGIDDDDVFTDRGINYPIRLVKPFLRSIDSMTDEEKQVYKEISSHLCDTISARTLIDWFNIHHFDYRGLIELGLALEAPKGMYNVTAYNSKQNKIMDTKLYSNCRQLNELAKEIHQDNVDRGFYEKPRETGTELMLIVSELSEALEAFRKDKFVNKEDLYKHIFDKDHFKEKIKDTFEDEIADALIRILDMCGNMNIDITEHVYQKLEYNRTREYKHGGKKI